MEPERKREYDSHTLVTAEARWSPEEFRKYVSMLGMHEIRLENVKEEKDARVRIINEKICELMLEIATGRKAHMGKHLRRENA